MQEQDGHSILISGISHRELVLEGIGMGREDGSEQPRLRPQCLCQLQRKTWRHIAQMRVTSPPRPASMVLSRTADNYVR